MGQVAPWKALNNAIKITDAMSGHARDIYDTKKRLLESGDNATVKQVGDGKDIISILSAFMELRFAIAGLTSSR
jgi:hypothetical protein